MRIITKKLENGNEVSYKIVNGTAYHIQTPDNLVNLLERIRLSGRRVRLFYGDVKTGRDWLEEYDTMGVISRSTGEIAVPILIRNKRSLGGSPILDHCIVKVTVDGNPVYVHPNYHQHQLFIDSTPVTINGKVYQATVCIQDRGIPKPHARFETVEKAVRWLDFITGRKNRR